ncbi:hypothetical protein ASF53_20850 [Methylobacterium sp. Leaf123]|nr:MBG domain-containing protein [Methylobacterium sp. Leaf123]KQQ26388.1 hypothetical protein ASF53_20850 [Methylobacterium sp. Leaf123]
MAAYAIDQGTLAATANYAVSYVGADLTVSPRPVTVMADARSRLYGDANPVLSYTVGGHGLVNGDRLTGALASAADGRSEVGAYAISQGTLAASADYALTYRGADLTVTPRPILVRADPQTRSAGTANPSLTYRIGGRGLVAGEHLTGALATTADLESAPGPYRITQGSLTASANYRLGFVGADLTVLPPQPEPLPPPLLLGLDASRLASTAERAARRDGRPAAPELPLRLGAAPGGPLVVADPRFDAILTCAGQQGGCFLTPLPPVSIPSPKPQASLPATAR